MKNLRSYWETRLVFTTTAIESGTSIQDHILYGFNLIPSLSTWWKIICSLWTYNLYKCHLSNWRLFYCRCHYSYCFWFICHKLQIKHHILKIQWSLFCIFWSLSCFVTNSTTGADLSVLVISWFVLWCSNDSKLLSLQKVNKMLNCPEHGSHLTCRFLIPWLQRTQLEKVSPKITMGGEGGGEISVLFLQKE